MRGLLRRVLSPTYRALETYVHPLRYLFVEITQRCNLSCRHCGSDCGREARAGELSTDEWLALFDYLPKHFDTSQMLLVVTGGEPFCHPDFDVLLSGLRRAGLPFGIVSNGWALTATKLENVLAHGLTSLTVSLDGLATSHDWLRGKSGSFERALSAIRHVVAAPVPLFDVVTCVNPRNQEELPALLELLRRERVPAWRLFTIFPRGRAKGDAELTLTDERLRTLYDWIARTRTSLGTGDMHVDFCCEGYLPSHIDRAVRGEPYFCRAGIAIGSVLCDGSISACPNISRALVQGNVRTDDLRRVWDERFVPFRDRSWMRTGDCVACGDWGRCKGNSLHLWDDEAQHTARCHRAAAERRG